MSVEDLVKICASPVQTAASVSTPSGSYTLFILFFFVLFACWLVCCGGRFLFVLFVCWLVYCGDRVSHIPGWHGTLFIDGMTLNSRSNSKELRFCVCVMTHSLCSTTDGTQGFNILSKDCAKW